MKITVLGSDTFKPAGRLTASGHLEIAHLAAQANAKTLVTTHLTPQFDAPGKRKNVSLRQPRFTKAISSGPKN